MYLNLGASMAQVHAYSPRYQTMTNAAFDTPIEILNKPTVVGFLVATITSGVVSWLTPDGNLIVTLVPV